VLHQPSRYTFYILPQQTSSVKQLCKVYYNDDKRQMKVPSGLSQWVESPRAQVCACAALAGFSSLQAVI
jgi:hypothetical protein